MKSYFYLIFLIVGISLAGLTGFQMITSLFSYPVFMTVSGYSMNPVLHQFDLLILEPIESTDVEIGLIVAVDHRGNGHFFEGYTVHRVIELKEIDGKQYVRTKGDYNSYADELVQIQDVSTKLSFFIPYVGFVLAPPVNVMMILVFLFLAFRYHKQTGPDSEN